MNKKQRTYIHFDCGYYSAENLAEWKPTVGVHNLVINTFVENVTYLDLVGRVGKKLKINEATTCLKLSYFPLIMDGIRHSFITDDEDVSCYLMEFEEQPRRILHVEVINHEPEHNQRVEENLGCAIVRREDCGSTIGFGNEELISNARANDIINDGILTLYEGEQAEPCDMILGGESNFRNTTRPIEQNYVGYETNEENYVGSEGNEENYVGSEGNEVAADTDRDDMMLASGTRNHDIAGIEWDDGIELIICQEFESKHEVQDIVEKASHKNCFEFAIVKSDTKRYVVKCCEWKNGCNWALRVAKVMNSSSFSVRTYNKMHKCLRASTSTSRNRRKGTSRLVASFVEEDFPGQFDTPRAKTLIGMVQGRLGVKVSYSTAWRGRQQAANNVRGSPEESYMMVYSYMWMLEKMNPGTVSHVELDEDHRFKYLFFALRACIEGFQAMRKVIIVDGTHIKIVHGGVLIVATTQDPNHHHYPIAFGVVDGEKDASWSWFFRMLKGVVADFSELVFISDRNQSLIKSIREVFPLAHHGYCIYHLSQNVKSSCSNVNRDIVAAKFRECAQAYTEDEFIKLYDAFRTSYPVAAVYLDKSVEPHKWARCYFPGNMYNIDTTNAAESINAIFREARKYSLLPMIDVIVGKLADWFNRHRQSSLEIPSTQVLVPVIQHKIHTRCMIAKFLTVRELNSFMLEYNVVGRDGNTYLVDLAQKTCSCKYLDIDKYPCIHAIAAAMSNGKSQIHDLCSKYYFVEQWVLAYCRTIYPVLNKSQWIVPDDVGGLCALPPFYVKTKGRNQERRFPSVGEYRGNRNKSVSGRTSRGRGMYTWFRSGGSEY